MNDTHRRLAWIRRLAIGCAVGMVFTIVLSAYMRLSRNDEVAAAMALALDRNLLEGLDKLPDATEVHHALFLLRRARGMEAPSFDDLRVSLRTKGMAA